MAIEDRKTLGEGGIWFADIFQQALGQSLEAMTTEQPKMEWSVVPSAQWTPDPSLKWAWWEQAITATSNTILWLGLSEADWNSIGKLALAAAGIDDATPEDCQGTWKEIGSQALSSSASAFGKRIRKEVNCGAGKDVDAPKALETCIEFTIEVAGSRHAVRLGWNADIQLILNPPPAAAPEPEQKSSAAPSAPAKGKSSTPAAVENSRTLSLLLEVELPVSVSFGRAQLPLKDVLKLNSGSIVELNRAIAEPVEIIVNNCVIARGEVVVVEGNYGVRIKQIISKEERLRTLY
ncbi:MAG: flagellar motor switch protein FliN [Acidobacteria bacterium]|nr:flagellar motor switch protein FliN [Acidobacteriota bacterium]